MDLSCLDLIINEKQLYLLRNTVQQPRVAGLHPPHAAYERAGRSKGKEENSNLYLGDHGIGKTETVESFARENGYQWAYIAPAQFEEIGDLPGMPRPVKHEDRGKVRLLLRRNGYLYRQALASC